MTRAPRASASAVVLSFEPPSATSTSRISPRSCPSASAASATGSAAAASSVGMMIESGGALRDRMLAAKLSGAPAPAPNRVRRRQVLQVATGDAALGAGGAGESAGFQGKLGDLCHVKPTEVLPSGPFRPGIRYSRE